MIDPGTILAQIWLVLAKGGQNFVRIPHSDPTFICTEPLKFMC